MAEVFAALVVIGIVLAILAVVGHGIWVLAAAVFGGNSARKQREELARELIKDVRPACPRCLTPFESPRGECPICSWPSSMGHQPDAQAGLAAVREQLNRYARLGVIDEPAQSALIGEIEREAERLAERIVAARRVAEAEPAAPALPAAPVFVTAPASGLPPASEAAPVTTVQPGAPQAEPTLPSAAPIGERARRFAASRAEAAPSPGPSLEGTEIDVAKPSVPVSRILAAFMEEKNIRWGELLGGLLIVGCSIALVISFWSEIAARPLLKFGLFNGVTAALFGAGLYTDRRWKIHTTSHGVLIIATLLVPLNFLAIAALTQASPPTGLVSLAGEAATLIVFALLVYLAGRILVPGGALLLVAGVMVPSLMQLIVRRFAEPGMPLVWLYALAGVPIASYLATSIVSTRKVAVGPPSRGGPGAAVEVPLGSRHLPQSLLVFLGLVSAATLLPLALLTYRSPPLGIVLQRLSPLIAVSGLPALLIGLVFWRRRITVPPAQGLDETAATDSVHSSAGLQTAGIAVGVLGAMIMVGAVVLAWPEPALLLPTALILATAMISIAIGFAIPSAYAPAGVALAAAWLIGFYLVRGDVAWTSNDAQAMRQTLVSATSGHALLPLAGIFAAFAGWLSRTRRTEDSFIVGLVAAGTAAVSLGMVMWFGFARAGDPANATWTLALYTLAALAAAVWLNREDFAYASAALMLATLVQAIVYRYALSWPPGEPSSGWIMAVLAHSTLAAASGGALRFSTSRTSGNARGALVRSALITSLVAAASIALATDRASASGLSMNLAWLAGLWTLLAVLAGSQLLFGLSQTALVLSIMCGVTAAVSGRAWYIAARHPWLDPWFLEAQGIALAAYCLLMRGVRGMFDRAARSGNGTDMERPPPHWAQSTRQFLSSTWPSLEEAVEVGLVLLAGSVAVYAALPGAAQELTPRAAGGVAPIEQFQLVGVPNAHAAGWGAWALVAAVIIALSARLFQAASAWRLIGLVLAASSVCPLMAARWEPELAVASALRWFSAAFFAVASVVIWTFSSRSLVLGDRAAGEETEPDVSNCLRQLRDVLVALVVLMYAAMGAYVAEAAIRRTGMPGGISWLWPYIALWAVMLAIAALVVPRRAAWQTSNLLDGKDTEPTDDWVTGGRNALLIMALAPVVVLLTFAVARALDQYPIAGPLPMSWFRRIGWDVSYGVPLTTVGLVLVGYAVRDRSSQLAFAAGLLANVVATIVVLIRVARGSAVLDAADWITVAQVNAVVAGVVALVWLAAIEWHRRSHAEPSTGSSLRGMGKAAWPILLVTQVILTGALCAFFLVPAIVRVIAEPQAFSWASAADGAIGWFAVVLTMVATVWLDRGHRIRSSFKTPPLPPGEGRGEGNLPATNAPSPFPLPRGEGFGAASSQTNAGLISAAVVAIIALTAARWDNGNWLAFHTLLAGTCAAAWLLPIAVRSMDHSLRAAQGGTGPIVWSIPEARLFGLAAVLLAVRAYANDPSSPWWTLTALVAIGARAIWIAWHEKRPAFVWIAAALVAPAASIFWLDWADQFSPTRGVGQIAEFVWINVIAAAAVAVVSVCVVRRSSAVRETGRWRSGLAFHRFAAWAMVAALLVTTAAGLLADLANGSFPVSMPLAWAAWFAAAAAACACWWDPAVRWPVACLYCVGLVAVGIYLDGLNFAAPMFHWALALALAAYSLATSALWSGRDKLAQVAHKWGLPAVSTSGHGWLVSANIVLGVGVLILVSWLETTMPEFGRRMFAAYAVGAQVFAIGLLARGAMRTGLQYLALVWGVLFAVAFAWAWLPPDFQAPWLHRLVVTVVALVAMVVLYGFAIVKFLRRENEWTRAGARLVTLLSALAAALIMLILAIEVSTYIESTAHIVPIVMPAVVAVGLSLLALALAALVAALLPGRDPLGLSERGRTLYVYAAEVLAALLFVHIRVTMPWLFRGWFTQFWPLVVMAIAFVGVGFGELFERTRKRVLAEPLQNTGVLLPLLPALGFWLVPSRVDYSLLLLAIGVLYTAMSVLRQSFWYAVMAALAANGSLWHWLYTREGFGLVEHPQLWLIPPALCALAAGYINRRRLTAQQSAALRYAAAIVIYASSTADVFIQGVAKAPWLPAVLAGLSILGVLVGIMLRVRAFLYLGTTFLVVSLLTVIWHAAIHERHTWILWVAGIITGVLIIVMFGLFEKRRDDVLRVVEQFKHWEA